MTVKDDGTKAGLSKISDNIIGNEKKGKLWLRWLTGDGYCNFSEVEVEQRMTRSMLGHGQRARRSSLASMSSSCSSWLAPKVEGHCRFRSWW